MKKLKTKQGAASFYIVTIAMILFGIITASFARVMLSEFANTLDDTLSQSAYDSALAGIEDAKLVLAAYRDCSYGTADNSLNNLAGAEKCSDVKEIDDNMDSCYFVPKMVYGGQDSDYQNGVFIQEQNKNGETTQQAYTCIKLNSHLSDYRGTLTSTNTTQLVPLPSSEVKSVRISWYSTNNGTTYNYKNSESFNSLESDSAATPPSLFATVIQTAETFTLDQLADISDNATDRGSILFVAKKATASQYSETTNVVSADELIQSNNHSSKNEPKQVECAESLSPTGEFACSVTINLSNPVGDNRGSDSTYLLLNLPYQTPDTDFTVEMCSQESCEAVSNDNNGIIQFTDIQWSVDSTGRASDIVRRVEARINLVANINYPYTVSAIELYGDEASLSKNYYVTTNCKTKKSNGGWQDCSEGNSKEL